MSDFSLEELARELPEFKVSLTEFDVSGKVIGTGGYGRVLLGTHKVTGKQCAIKELREENLDEKHTQYYCREIKIFSLCHHPFLLPFVGFTIDFPFSIITEFMPNGSLADALHRHKLSCTQKSQIAFGIAAGMNRLHELRVIHRDLKPQNILLDELNLPRVADFGASQMQIETDQQMTSGIGTLNWMAPELFDTSGYDNKVDVYSFGLILWEMVTEQVPFAGLQQAQIMSAVLLRQERPVIPQSCPKTLAGLIQSCWHPSPHSRPSFKKIYKLFKKKSALFEGTEDSSIDALIKYYKKQTKAQTRTHKDLFLSNSALDIEQELHNLTLETASPCFGVICECLSNKGVSQSTILHELLKLFVDRSDLIECFLEEALSLSLPYADSELGNLALSVLIPVFEAKSVCVSQSLIELLVPLIAERPKKILRLFSIYCNDFEGVPHNWMVSDLLIMRANDFFAANVASPLIQILYRLCASSATFREGRLAYCIETFKSALFLQGDESAVHTAYSALIAFRLPKIEQITDWLAAHLSGLSLRLKDDALVLLSYSLVDITEDLISNLIVALNTSEIADFALLNQMQSKDACILMLKQSRSWIENEKNGLIVKILLRVLCFPELLPQLREIPKLCQFFGVAACSSDPELLMSLRSTLRRVDPTPAMVTELSKSGFIRSFLLSSTRINSDEVYHQCFLLIDSLIRKQYVPDFLEFMNSAAEFLLTRPILLQDTLTYLLIMTIDQRALQRMKDLRIPDKLKEVDIPERLQEFFVQFNAKFH